jgi:hypothetical protein
MMETVSHSLPPPPEAPPPDMDSDFKTLKASSHQHSTITKVPLKGILKSPAQQQPSAVHAQVLKTRRMTEDNIKGKSSSSERSRRSSAENYQSDLERASIKEAESKDSVQTVRGKIEDDETSEADDEKDGTIWSEYDEGPRLRRVGVRFLILNCPVLTTLTYPPVLFSSSLNTDILSPLTSKNG